MIAQNRSGATKMRKREGNFKGLGLAGSLGLMILTPFALHLQRQMAHLPPMPKPMRTLNLAVTPWLLPGGPYG
jgi:uncharacterized protein YbcC (UPF0753/DUF2309 family)